MKAIKTPIIINSIRFRRDGSLGFSGETPEYKTEEKVAFGELQGKQLNAIFEPEDETIDEVVEVDKDLEQKSQAQRIRSILFLLWKQEGEQGEFRDYYHSKTNRYIEFLKEKLDD